MRRRIIAGLSDEQLGQYRQNGVLVTEDVISVYNAGDAVPCVPNPLPGGHEGLFVRGSNPHRVGAEDYEIEVPEFPKTSFFAQQSERERTA